MRSKRLSVALILPWLGTMLALPQSYLLQEPQCPDDIVSVEIQQVEIVVYMPTHISFMIPTNTLIIIDEGQSINITNAPITLITEIGNYVTTYTTLTR
jgi:predicted ribonuclease YlaK